MRSSLPNFYHLSRSTFRLYRCLFYFYFFFFFTFSFFLFLFVLLKYRYSKQRVTLNRSFRSLVFTDLLHALAPAFRSMINADSPFSLSTRTITASGVRIFKEKVGHATSRGFDCHSVSFAVSSCIFFEQIEIPTWDGNFLSFFLSFFLFSYPMYHSCKESKLRTWNANFSVHEFFPCIRKFRPFVKPLSQFFPKFVLGLCLSSFTSRTTFVRSFVRSCSFILQRRGMKFAADGFNS